MRRCGTRERSWRPRAAVRALATTVGLAVAAPVLAGWSPQQAGDGRAALLARARAALSRGDPAAVVALLEPALVGGEEDPRLLFYLGRAYLEAGRLREALQALSRARTATPRPPAAVLFWEGVAAQRLGDMETARARFAQVLESDPRSEPARLQLGWILLSEERAAEAEELFAAVVGDHPSSATARYYLGLSRHAVGDLGGARDAYAEAVNLDPELVDARVALGRVQHELGRPAAAREELEAALALAPDDPGAGFELARLDLEAGDTDSAIEHLETVVAADPTHAPARYQLGLAYRRAGRILESEAMLAGHAALESGRRTRERRALGTVAARSTYERALEHLAAGEPTEAADAFRATLEAAGEDATAAPWLGLGAACLESGDAACAVDALRRAVELDPAVAVSHLLLAQALQTLGRPSEASAAFDRWKQLVGSKERR